MKRIKISIALITMFGLLGTAGVAIAKTTSQVHPKVSQTSTKSTHPQAKSQISKKTVHKTVKSVKSAKTVKSAKLLTKHVIKNA